MAAWSSRGRIAGPGSASLLRHLDLESCGWAIRVGWHHEKTTLGTTAGVRNSGHPWFETAKWSASEVSQIIVFWQLMFVSLYVEPLTVSDGCGSLFGCGLRDVKKIESLGAEVCKSAGGCYFHVFIFIVIVHSCSQTFLWFLWALIICHVFFTWIYNPNLKPPADDVGPCRTQWSQVIGRSNQEDVAVCDGGKERDWNTSCYPQSDQPNNQGELN